MTMEIPRQPSFDPADDSKEGLDAWTDLWVDYRDEVAALLVELLEGHDNARELVAELQRFGKKLEDDPPRPRQWKRALVSKGPKEFYALHHDKSYERLTFHRSEDGRWICPDVDTADADNPDEAEATAKALLSYLIWWGDLNAIFLAKHYRGPSSFIPPEGCD